ncbi:MAG: transcriptional repressor [Christensenellaceae bacterium]|nr:transcriptional repressor [Christensenellaceae bacterium]MDD6927246.1 transcriptional repressor [bacterium]MDY2851483.1 transcriptional repressor [Christensenellaceae bacterium]
MNYSRQRELILDFLKSSKEHPTAERILEKVREADPLVARGTVYRNLTLLAETGEIIKISTCAGGDRFDYIHEKHSHAICKRCGKVFDFSLPVCGELVLKLEETMEFISSECGVTVTGICEDCKKNA